MIRPEVSVVVPVRNGARTLEAQLAALQAQRVDFDWELLIADNGSTDGTADLARSWEARIPGIRVVDASARRGPAAARNIGAAEARADLLVFCDADDQADPDWLGRMRGALDRVSIAFGGWDGELLNRHQRFALSWSPTTEYRKDYLPAMPGGAGNNMGIRAEMFRAVGGFDESMETSEDMDLAWRVQLAGGTFEFLPEAIMHIRRRDGVRAVWRQAHSYGRGEFRLKHKYAKVIAAYGELDDAAPQRAVDPSTPARGGLVARTRRFIAGRGRLHLADRLWRVGLRRGEASGEADPSWTQIEPPPVLPRN